MPAGSSYTAKSFVATVGSPPGLGNGVTVAFRINQVNSPLICTISGASATSCEPPAGTQVAVPAGSKISMQSTTTGVPLGVYVAYAYRAEF